MHSSSEEKIKSIQCKTVRQKNVESKQKSIPQLQPKLLKNFFFYKY